MDITLEKIELVQDRTGATYAEARAALDANDGSVVDAIISIEDKINKSTEENESPLLHKVKEMGENMDINDISEKAKEYGEKGLEIGKEYYEKLDKEKIASIFDMAKTYINKGVELGKQGMDKAGIEIDKQKIADAYLVAKDYAVKAYQKGEELYYIGKEKADEYKVKDKVMGFIDFVGEKAKKIDEVMVETAKKDGAIVVDSEIIDEDK